MHIVLQNTAEIVMLQNVLQFLMRCLALAVVT